MKLSVNLVSWNGAKYIPYLMKSLRNQTFKDWSLFVLDNHSTDNTVEMVKRETENFPVFVEIVENSENLGFSGGHNLAFKKTESDYVLLLNQDTYLMPNYLEKLVNFMDAHQDAAAVSGRLMKWEFGRRDPSTSSSAEAPDFLPLRQAGAQDDNKGSDRVGAVDSLGLRIFRNRRVMEIPQLASHNREITSLSISPQRGDVSEVFGVSGTLPVFCREALQEVAYEDGNIFDPLYESYKEDVDLAYRFQLQGLKAYVLEDVVAYHDRTGVGPKEKGDWAVVKNKKNQSPRIALLSYRNHLMNLYKNEIWQNLALDFFPIFWYELKKFVYYLLMDRAVLGGWVYIWKNRKDLKNKRRAIQAGRKIEWREFRKWF